jgi:hypothetical protein
VKQGRVSLDDVRAAVETIKHQDDPGESIDDVLAADLPEA